MCGRLRVRGRGEDGVRVYSSDVFVNDRMWLFQRCACTTAASTTRVRRGQSAATWSVSVMTLELVSTPARASEATATTTFIIFTARFLLRWQQTYRAVDRVLSRLQDSLMQLGDLEQGERLRRWNFIKKMRKNSTSKSRRIDGRDQL